MEYDYYQLDKQGYQQKKSDIIKPNGFIQIMELSPISIQLMNQISFQIYLLDYQIQKQSGRKINLKDENLYIEIIKQDQLKSISYVDTQKDLNRQPNLIVKLIKELYKTKECFDYLEENDQKILKEAKEDSEFEKTYIFISQGNQDENEKNFFKIIKDNEGKPLDFIVYNMATRSFRTIQIIPSYQWNNSDGLLGISLRYEKWQDSHELTFKVQNVYKNSPAEKAKLQSSSDYIVGLQKYKYQNEEEMIKYITECEYENDGFIEVAIYNQISKQVRIVKLFPCSKWGGKGSLGLELGSGMLNQIPQIKDSFEEKQLYNSIFNTENEDISIKQNEQYQGNCSQNDQKQNL
ncbi:PDZ domain [Pseudocohnilembus persalinus]|uniref:PDZ domain n=1 Tax=Pseudocohnilembus persalinus TaxID=266149 RepID=A0A0V0QI16_PSEPJ|nr:PDZ domain [Pseudocohnilembus persalinus]|eukprot:KRX01838.1 PDZ domain [Pseudocohnilembus persalinus]